MRFVLKKRGAVPYRTKLGKSPFYDWLGPLRDSLGKARLLARLERAESGLFGDCRDLKGGIFELRDDFGPGYRVYFGIHLDYSIVLLTGGAKGSQARDIAKARVFWSDFLKRCFDE